MTEKSAFPLALAVTLALAACSTVRPQPALSGLVLDTPIAETAHRDGDDLLTGGLGAAGLASPVAPSIADAASPTAAELRRRAIWTNWRGIADLAPGGGFGQLYGSLQPVAGREYHAFARLPGARQPHRVMVQLPDAFDLDRRCVVVAASSGSRGIYGAIALAGSWGLAQGCAVAYTDKGAGTGYVDTATGVGTALDGRPAIAGVQTEFSVPRHDGEPHAPIAVKHAHSGDNPEADWGRHVEQAAQFALRVLDSAHPAAAPFDPASTRVIAVGVSNGAGAVLRAAELPGNLLDGVIAVSPNVFAGDGGRALYDYSTEAALFMPCALNATQFDSTPLARVGGVPSSAGTARCASLRDAGLLPGNGDAAQTARAYLNSRGWPDAAIAAGAISTGFDLWRAVDATYASSYARAEAADMPCGYSFHAMDASGAVKAPTAQEKALWWSDASGIPPGTGVGLRDALAAGADPAWAGLRCLRAQWQGTDPIADRINRSIAATRANLPREGLPVLVMHGADDGLVPAAFSGAPYAAWAKGQGRDVRYWRINNAQHFDAFLGLPALGAHYVPMLPYAYRGLDAMWQHVSAQVPLPGDLDIQTTPRTFDGKVLAPLGSVHLGKLP